MANNYKLAFPINVVKKEQKPKKIHKNVVGNEEDSQVQDDATINNNQSINQLQTTVIKRPILRKTKNKDVLITVGHVKQYLEETGVTVNMKKLTVELFQSKILPYNPFPGYVRRFRRLAEKFHLKQKTLEQLKHNVSQCPTFQVSSGLLSGVKIADANIWGLKHILSSINPKVLKPYEYVLRDSYVPDTTIRNICGKDVTLILSLNGPCIFNGSVYPKCFHIKTCGTILILSNSVDKIGKLFGLAVIEDIKYILDHKEHILLKIKIPVYNQDAQWKLKIIPLDEIVRILENESTRNELIDKLGFAVQNGNVVSVELVVFVNYVLPRTKNNYLPMTKTYCLISNSARSTSSKNGLNTTLLPYQSIHEGIFFNRNKAEIYLSTFKEYTTSKSPLYAPVISSIKEVWHDVLSQNLLGVKPLDVLHHLYLLDKLQNQSKTATVLTENDISIQIARVSQGNAFTVYSLFKINSCIQNLLKTRSIDLQMKEKTIPAINDLFDLYFQCLLEHFYLHDHPSDILDVKDIILFKLNEIKSTMLNVEEVSNVCLSLQFLQGYTNAIALLLFDDALDNAPIIKSTKAKYGENYPVLNANELGIDQRENIFNHGVKNTHYSNVDSLLLDIDQCIQSGNAPKHIVTEASLMQYCVDIHIDEIWQNFMQILLIEKQHLPPNPYPQLVSLLKQASIKVQLYRDTDFNVAKKFIQNKVKLYDGSTKTYTIASLHAYGSMSALKVVNSAAYRQIQGLAENIAIVKPNAQESGSPAIRMQKFEIKCLSALCSQTLIYGSASPYLCEINLNEHCFIRGPNDYEHKGITALGQIIVMNIKNLHSDGILPCEATFGTLKLDITDFSNLESRITDEFISCVSDSQEAQLTILAKLDWRYILVRKTIYVYYINESNETVSSLTKYSVFTDNDQAFFNAFDALDYISLTKHLSSSLSEKEVTQSLQKAWQNFNWSELSYFVLKKATLKYLSQNKLSDTDYSMIAFCWRYFHSAAGSLHYCNCLTTSIKFALRHLMLSHNKNDIQPVVESMIMGYKNKLNFVFNSASTMVPLVFNTILQYQTQSVTNVDLSQNSISITDYQELYNTLSKNENFVKFTEDAIFYEVLKSSPIVKNIIHSF